MVETTESALADYLSRLHGVTDSVRLLGDKEERRLLNVFVDMDVAVSDERRTPILRDLLRKPLEDDRDEEGDPARAELLLELSARADRTDGSLVTASRTLELGPRVLLTGVAGAGKTTLLRWLANEVARSAELVPIWVPHLPELSGDLAEQLAQIAVNALSISDKSLAPALAESVRSGRAQLLIDALDEAPEGTQRALLGRLAEIGPSVRVIVATRPLGESPAVATGFVRARLLGLRAGGAEAFLRRYFHDAPWVDDLVRDLFSWPGAEPWQDNPALLSLAASLYRSGKKLEGSAVDLYEAATQALIRGAHVEHAGAVREELIALAQRMFAPEKGPPRALLLREEASAEAQSTGLLRGGAWLRFAHLSLGEYLAACGDLDLAKARAKFRTSAHTALELLPMAHALRGEAALSEALADADREDTDDHRMLALVLRSIAFAGERARSFASANAGGIVRRVAARLGSASARFGAAEEALAEHAQRALFVLKAELKSEDVEPLRELTKSLGNVGAEANVLLWTAGLGEPVRKSAHGKAARRVGAALVRARMDVSWIVAHTGGEPVFFVRAAAVSALANDPEAYPLLRERLTDDDANVRAAAVSALAKDPASRPLLRERLADEDVDVKAGAITALADDPDSRPLIRERLKDNEPTDNNVRSAAILALANDPASYPLLRERLSDRSGTVRVSAFQALAKDPESWALLREKTSDMDYNVRAAAFQALANDPSSLPMLRERLSHESYAVRAAAVGALATDPSSFSMLRERLADESWSVRAAAATALAKDEASWASIRPLLSDSDKDVRASAIEALAKDPASHEAIRGLLGDKAARVRAAAAAALGEGAQAAADRAVLAEHVTPSDPAIRAAAFHALATDPGARSFLRERLDDEDLGVKNAVFEALANDPEARPLLRARLSDPVANARAAATRALANDPESRPLLRERLDDADPNVRTEAVRALANDLESRTLLRERIADMAPAVRAAAVIALSTDPLARSLLRERLADEDNDVRAAAVYALGSDPEARALIRERLADTAPTVRVAAVRMLAGDPASRQPLGDGVPTLRALLRERLEDRAGTVRAAAVYAVMNDPEARPMLRERLTDDDDLGPSGRRTGEVIRAAAVTALASDPSARPLLVERLADPAPTVRAAAVYALARDEGSRSIVRATLMDKASGVRAAAAHALCVTAPASQGVAVSTMESDPRWAPAFRAARATTTETATASAAAMAGGGASTAVEGAFESGSLEARILAFAQAPSPLDLAKGELAEALLALVLVRLGWAAEGGRLGPSGRVLGEVPKLPVSLLGQSTVVRLRMSAEELPKERLFHPLHNLMEAWQLARHLRAPSSTDEAPCPPTSLWLACADVHFEDLVPPALKPGEVHWGPTFWGFILPQISD